MKLFCSIVVLLCLGASDDVAAHGDLHEQIEAVSLRIARAPTAELFLKRGELRRAHLEFDRALADYDKAEQLNPAMAAVLLSRGRALIEAQRYAPAREALDRFLEKRPAHSEGYLTRGRACAALKEFSAAVQDFNRAIDLAPEAGPDHFVERAQAQIALGDADGAINGLEEGIRQLGPLFTLQAQALEIERKQKRFDAALQRLDGLLAQSQRKESWLVQQGAIFEEAGRPEEARRSYQAALAAIATLPPRLRVTKATREIENRARALVKPPSQVPQ